MVLFHISVCSVYLKEFCFNIVHMGEGISLRIRSMVCCCLTVFINSSDNMSTGDHIAAVLM